MPTYKVSYPYLVVEAPTEAAAVEAYNRTYGDSIKDLPMVDLCGDVPDVVVDADGHEIEEWAHGCTPSTKHPGRCAECGEPLFKKEEG